MSEPASTANKETGESLVRNRRGAVRRSGLFCLWFVVAIGLYAQTQFWKQPSGGDRANWDYFAQVIARGGIPYRDVVNIKSPLSAYIGAGAIVLTRPFGLRDIFAIRIAFVLLAALTVALTFLVTLDYFDDFRVASLAALIMFTFHAFVRFNGGGVQPKTPMILSGLLALRAVVKDRPLKAGVLGMLSALSWQPGLLFVGSAGLAFSRYLTSWRDLKVVKLILGAAIPLLVMITYFWMTGAMRDFYIWNVHFNATVYAIEEARSPAGFLDHISTLLFDAYHDSRIYFYMAIAGISITLWQEISSGVRLGCKYFLESAPRHAITISPLVYFAFCVVNIQAAPDLIPLLPFVAAFAAVAIVFVIKREANLILRALPKLNRTKTENWGCIAIAALILFFNISGELSVERGFPTLQDQDREVAQIVSQLMPGDKIYVHGRTEILVLSGLKNADRHFLLDRGKSGYLDQVEPGGFDGWLERLKAERPGIVVLDRTHKVARMKDLEDWVARDYVPRVTPMFTYWIRRDISRLLLGRFVDVVTASRPADADESQYFFGKFNGAEDVE